MSDKKNQAGAGRSVTTAGAAGEPAPNTRGPAGSGGGGRLAGGFRKGDLVRLPGIAGLTAEVVGRGGPGAPRGSLTVRNGVNVGYVAARGLVRLDKTPENQRLTQPLRRP